MLFESLLFYNITVKLVWFKYKQECYMCDSVCRCILLKVLKYFEILLNILEFSHVQEIGLCKYVSMNHTIMFLDRDSKTKLVPAFFFLIFRALMRQK